MSRVVTFGEIAHRARNAATLALAQADIQGKESARARAHWLVEVACYAERLGEEPDNAVVADLRDALRHVPEDWAHEARAWLENTNGLRGAA